MESITLKANAKINLSLDILGKRAGGYHEIETVMQSVSLYDTVKIEKSRDISVLCSDSSLCGSKNLAYAEAKYFCAAAGLSGGAAITIEKRIPTAAGLGGGSADAAAVIMGLNSLYGTGYSPEKLCEIGLHAGADVPFCIMGGTMLAKGVGEIMTPLVPLPGCSLVVAKQGEKSSTGSLYARFDQTGAKKRPDLAAMCAALSGGDINAVAAGLCNVFEELVPQSDTVKQQMLEHGALGASLSGSGPSVFGIFDSIRAAKDCAAAIGETAHVCAAARCGCEVIEVIS